MKRFAQRLRTDPGCVLLLGALLASVCIYAPTLTRGLVNYDDPWLIADNWILQRPSWSTLQMILFDLDSPQRFVLTPEYLPVRDLSVMCDFVIWGSWYPGFHLTNLALYLGAIVVWFIALTEFGVDRKIAGLALLLWAVHPTHAESVAWLSERKGLLAVLFAGVCVLAYARYRVGRSVGWLVVAATTAVLAVWSKGTGAFAVASVAALELLVPARRNSWRRSLAGLTAIAAVAGAAFIPVVMLARQAQVIGADVHSPAGWPSTVVGVHGFYLSNVALTMRNAVSYPISSNGPSIMHLVIGAVGLVALAGLAALPRIGCWRVPHEMRAGAALWLLGWFPVSHLLFPLQMVFVADRYMLFPTLGLVLIVASGLMAISGRPMTKVLIAVIVLASALRAFDAQANWRDPTTLWARAVESNPRDGSAWANYVEVLVTQARSRGDRALAEEVLLRGLSHSDSPRLLHRQALFVLETERARGIEIMTRAAEGGEPIAMSNLALLLLDEGKLDEAVEWARRGVTYRPNAHAQRALGKVALARGLADEALVAFSHAYALEPLVLSNRFNLALALVAVGRESEARDHFEACLAEPALASRARDQLAKLAK